MSMKAIGTLLADGSRLSTLEIKLASLPDENGQPATPPLHWTSSMHYRGPDDRGNNYTILRMDGMDAGELHQQRLEGIQASMPGVHPGFPPAR